MSKTTENMDEILEETAQETVAETHETTAEAATEAAEEVQPTELEQTKAELDAMNDKYMRILAEYDNFRKRSAKEREGIYPEAKAAALAGILPVLDNFERALAAPCTDDGFKQGMEMIYKSFLEMLTKQGVEAFGEVGDPFDPNLHNAVAHADDDSVGDNCIAEVFQRGYRMDSRVLRYAMVKVAN